MMSRLIKRFLQTLVSLLLLVLFSFFLSRVLPGDPAKYILTFNNSQVVSSAEGRAKCYEQQYRQMGLHLPFFYFSLESILLPDSFIHLPDNDFKFLLCSLSYYSGSPRLSYSLAKKIVANKENEFLVASFQRVGVSRAVDDLLANRDVTEIDEKFLIDLSQLKSDHENQYWKRWIPSIRWNAENQFHLWCFGGRLDGSGFVSKGIVRGDFGKSWTRGGDVFEMVKFPFLLTLFLSVFVLLVTFPLALITGGWLVFYQRKWYAKIQKPLFIFTYSIPTFWMGTALLLFFANPRMLDWLPSASPVLETKNGFGSWFLSLVSQAEYLIIPLFTLGYSTLIYLSQMVFELLKDELQKPYVLTLRAVGSSERKIIFYYSMKNILVPVIVSGMSVFPLLLGGSVIIDFLFTMPGMGSSMLQACDQKDFPVISGILFVSGLVTMLSFALTDLFTSQVNPLIRQSNFKKNG
ncbi:MAG: ABC transporter permease [Bacteroidetes bacterium]|nr:ABC transporter permease [Bacteroidota bacterium]